MDLQSERGARNESQFYHTNDGYHYHKYKEVGQTRYFRCIHRWCSARCLLRLGEFEQRSDHNHEPVIQRVQFLRERRGYLNDASILTHVPVRNTFNFDR